MSTSVSEWPRHAKPPRACSISRAHDEVIVDFAVEDDGPAPGSTDHRLTAGLGQVNDREPAMREREPLLGPGDLAMAVRPAVTDRISHRAGELGERSVTSSRGPETGYSTHGEAFSAKKRA